MTDKQKVKISALKQIALEYSDVLMEDKEAREENLTDIFSDELKKMIEARELINIQIIGDVATSKSTTALKIASVINKILGKRMKLEYVCRDQIEFARKTIDERRNHVCYVIDEYSRMSDTSYNSSTEQAYLDWQSDVCAQEFIHKIGCSPDKIIDKNANIVLEVVGKDTDRKITRLLVSYKVLRRASLDFVLIGHIDVYVGDTIESDWYKEYRRRKFAKMELIKSYGLRDLRELEYAEFIWKVYKDNYEPAEWGWADDNSVESDIKDTLMENKRFESILGEKFLTRMVMARLIHVENLGKAKRKLRVLETRESTDIEEVELAKKQIEKAKEKIARNESNMKKLMQLKKDFERIDNAGTSGNSNRKD